MADDLRAKRRGKITLLSAVSQELPYTGLVTLDGTDLRRMKPRPLARRMAMLRQLSDLALRLHGGRGRRDGAIRASGAFAGGQRRRGSGGARAPSRAIAGQAPSKHPDALRRRTPGGCCWRRCCVRSRMYCCSTNPATIWIYASSRNYSCSSTRGGANRDTRWYPACMTCPLRGSSARTRCCFPQGGALTAKSPPS